MKPLKIFLKTEILPITLAIFNSVAYLSLGPSQSEYSFFIYIPGKAGTENIFPISAKYIFDISFSLQQSYFFACQHIKGCIQLDEWGVANICTNNRY